MATQIIYVAGDIHRDWASLNNYINKEIRLSKKFKKLIAEYEKESTEVEVFILLCGDFGIWQQSDIDNLPVKNKIDFLKDGHIKIYFADGNRQLPHPQGWSL